MTDGSIAPGLSERRQQLIDALKRRGSTGVAELADHVGLNVETVREHLATLEAQQLVARVGTRSAGRGRPEVLYGLSAEAQRLFPSREPDVLTFMARHLERTGRSEILAEAIDAWIEVHRDTAMTRLEAMGGPERIEAAAQILAEMGFMPEVGDDGASLTLCHCPLRDLVEVSRLPCRAEIHLVAELLGERPDRTSWIPDGDATCSYRLANPSGVAEIGS